MTTPKLIGGSTISDTDPLAVSLAGGDHIPGTGATNLGKAEDAAHTSGDVGVLMLGVRNDSLVLPSDANGDYSYISLGNRGQVWTAPLGNGALTDAMVAHGFSQQNSSTFPGGTASMLYNGSWDRQRGNVETTILTSSARTTTTNGADQTNYNGGVVMLILDITAFAATPTLTPKIQGKSPVSGAYFDLLVGSAINVVGVGIYVYILGLGAVETSALANVEVQGLPCPRTWRPRIEAGDADSCTYSVASVTIVQ